MAIVSKRLLFDNIIPVKPQQFLSTFVYSRKTILYKFVICSSMNLK